MLLRFGTVANLSREFQRTSRSCTCLPPEWPFPTSVASHLAFESLVWSVLPALSGKKVNPLMKATYQQMPLHNVFGRHLSRLLDGEGDVCCQRRIL